jgi:hypothetical protein
MPKNITYDTKLGFLGSGEDIFVRVQWEPGNVKVMCQLLLGLVSGNAFNILWEYIEKYAESIEDLEGLAEIKQFLHNNLQNKNQEGSEDSNEPMIQPINTIRHILTLYQEQ